MSDEIETETEIDNIEEIEEEQDIIIELNTLTQNVAETSIVLNGKIKAIILTLEKPVDIEIFFTDWPSIRIYEVRNFTEKDFYLVPKVDSFNTIGEIYNYNADLWFLRNDEITFRIKGGHDAKVRFTVRLD